MNFFNFEKQTTFVSSELLNKRFGVSTLTLAAKSTVTFHGLIYLSNYIEFVGDCFLGSGSCINSGSYLENVKFGKNNNVRQHSVMVNCTAADENIFGPFCFVRDFCSIGNNCIVGSHVEMTRSSIKDNVKVSHQSFIGDAKIQSNVTVGASVVFCNHDGTSKKKSVVENNTLIGSGSLLIAPTKIGSDVTIGAGSVVKGVVASGSKIIQKRQPTE